MKACCILVS